jgi:hypothetical protein
MKMQMGNIIDVLTGRVTESATQKAISTASATPFNVILTVDDSTQTWLTQLAAIIVAVGIFTHQVAKRKK